MSHEKWECTVCGYVYDPASGDPGSGVVQGTSFENIPESWVCPVCGAGKDAFVMLKDQGPSGVPAGEVQAT